MLAGTVAYSKNSTVPSLIQKGKQVESNQETSHKTLNSLPASSVKSAGKMGTIKSSIEGEFDTQSDEELSDSLSAQLKVRDSGGEVSSSSSKDVKPGKSGNTISKGQHTQKPYKPEKWMLPHQAEDTLTQLNLAIVSERFLLIYVQ